MFSEHGIVPLPRRRVQAQHNQWQTASLCVLLLLLVLLGACASVPGGRADADERYAQTRAQRLERAGQHEQAAELYAQLATGSDTPGKYWLLAAAQWHAAGNWDEVLRAVNAIGSPEDDDQRLQRALLGASAALALGEVSQARVWLDSAPAETPDRARPARLWLQVRLALAEGDVRRAIELNGERELWLATAQDVRNGRRALLDALAEDQSLYGAAPPRVEDDDYAGWLSLATIRAEADRDPFRVRSALRGWREQFPQHPAAILLPELFSEYQQLLEYPQKLAVLLPLSGRLAAAGGAVRDGLLAAYLRQDEARPKLRFYDTNSADVASLYLRAASEGADFVVGPLTRDAVDELAASAPLPLPTLALNNLSVMSAMPGIYQFGLAPEDEARQAAEHVVTAGLAQGIALVPASDWGNRMLGAFRAELEAAGGLLLDYQEYTPRDEDFSAPITTVLHLAESRDRYRSLSAVLGRRLEFEPRRREDVQFIFLAATPQVGRVMRPQLRFHYASDLPVFATSSIYEENPDRNGDLNGVSFVDIPWVIDDAPDIVAMREQLSRLFPQRMRAWPRLFALGFDAYRLVPALYSGTFPQTESIKGLTGELSLSSDSQIRRKLRWAQFSGGVPVLIADPEVAGVADGIDIEP